MTYSFKQPISCIAAVSWPRHEKCGAGKMLALRWVQATQVISGHFLHTWHPQ